MAGPELSIPIPGAKVWTRGFALLCIAVTLGYAHNALMMPAIPLYVDDKGGSALLAGLALLSFSLPSVVVRPWLGRLSDVWNPILILAAGLVALAVGGVLFVVPVLAMIFFAGIIRGLGWAGLNTGGYTALATIAPPSRRGEASGYYTAMSNSAAILFPAFAIWLIDGPGGFTLVFLLSAALAVAGLPFALGMSQSSAAAREAVAPSAIPVPAAAQTGLIERGVLVATALSLSSTLAAPAVNAFLPLYAKELDIGNIGLYYILAGITSIIVRPVLGRRSDLIGRGPAIGLGLVSQFLGFLLIMTASSLPQILAGGIFISIGVAMSSATTTALAMDLASPESRGKSMATFSISFQLGNGFGAILAGALADSVGFRGMYAGSILITVLGFALLAATWNALPRPGATATA